MAIHSNLRGIIGSILSFGKGAGSQIKDNSGVLEFRNSDDSAYVIIRALAPLDSNDVVTRAYADTISGMFLIARQGDCSVALPNNTATKDFVVVTTAGNGAVIGDLLFDDGSSAGTMEIISAKGGRSIVTTVALAGGTATFDADAGYTWDDGTSAWRKIFDVGHVGGAVREIRFAIDNSAQQDSTYEIPANVRAVHCSVEITTPYSAGATISVGSTSTATLLQATTDNDPQTADTYVKDQDTAWEVAASVVRVTVAGLPAAGVGVVVIRWANALA